MRHKAYTVLGVLLGVVAIAAAACGGGREAPTPTQVERPAATQPAAAQPTEKPTQPPGGAMAELPEIKLTMQANWPAGFQLFENFQRFADTVKAMSGGRLTIETLPAGAVVEAFETLDATSQGIIDGAHSWSGYWFGKHPAATLFYGGPGSFGMDYFDYLGWLFEGGGLELWQQMYQQELGLNVHVIPILYAGPQVLGWFNKPIRSVDDMKGLKWRIAGISGEVWQEFGSSTVQIPGGEILPSAERGVIEGAEWVTPGEDRKMGFHDIWKYYGMPALGEYVTGGELLINKDTWDSLPAEYQAMMKTAALSSTVRSWILLNKLNAEAMKALREEDGVTIFRTPQSVLEAFLRTWDEKVGPKYANQNAFFKKVWDSQREYASKVVPARAYIEPDKIWLAQWYFPDGGWVGVNMDELGQRVQK